MNSPAAKLREILARPGLHLMPCCFDALSAKLIEQAGFDLTFMSGFAVSATRLGLPDTGLISYGEMVNHGRNITAAVSIPVLGDGDTGYGNALNVKRTVHGYAQAGFACVMIEDQVAPKRCGHTEGKEVVDRQEARQRVRAAVDAREEGADILIMARTDARAGHGFAEALTRAQEFAETGADIVFLEAPQSEEELRTFCHKTPAPTMANMLENGKTPLLPPETLAQMGFKIAAYPLTLLNASIFAMQQALAALKQGGSPELGLDFKELRRIVGFEEYYAEEKRYKKGSQ
ncbi:MAG: isocitrate lyase/PEP mutase family protein [Desulfobulbaceae bacterium]|nr:isocitrate lyase/PEP mutase family protein [Desulfobulbaceae bacterium]HIJ78143.1 isocitrate lyase/PEP mutase family protein [Deltaproteobacteria bacterium]